MVAQELVHCDRKHHSKNGLMIATIDLRKTYDKMEWQFLDAALEAWGFGLSFKALILSCISTVQCNILINGSICGSFSPSRSLHKETCSHPFFSFWVLKFLQGYCSKRRVSVKSMESKFVEVLY